MVAAVASGVAFTANPEDYTARGKIVTPLKDRIGSEIRTHYPESLEEGITITAQEQINTVAAEDGEKHTRQGDADDATLVLLDEVGSVEVVLARDSEFLTHVAVV